MTDIVRFFGEPVSDKKNKLHDHLVGASQEVQHNDPGQLCCQCCAHCSAPLVKEHFVAQAPQFSPDASKALHKKAHKTQQKTLALCVKETYKNFKSQEEPSVPFLGTEIESQTGMRTKAVKMVHIMMIQITVHVYVQGKSEQLKVVTRIAYSAKDLILSLQSLHLNKNCICQA